MQLVNMLNEINMEFIQAFNPLYAIPIIAVILCAFIVYAFGFKSPVQPPSFEGIEEEKKYSKKRRAKDNQKGSKLLQNGKVNGNSMVKSNVLLSSKKKESGEKYVASEKSSSVEKAAVVDKKVPKKKMPNEKKSTQERKKESFSHEDLNDDGWVQLVSKKGRKNRKKDDAGTSETQLTTPLLVKPTDLNKSDDSSQVEESPKKNAEPLNDKSSVAQKQIASLPTKDVAAHVKSVVSNAEKPKMQNVVIEVSKPDNNNVEKQSPKEPVAKGTKVLEDSSKSKKKKKKSQVQTESVPAGTISSDISDSIVPQEKLEISAPKETTSTTPTVLTDLPQVISGKVEADVKTAESLNMKSSNVAFDELAGLYPETKEQKKKKKVRRDH